MHIDDALLDHALKVAREAVAAAGKVIHRYYRSDALSVEHKDDDSPVTRADVEAEQAIREVLLDAFPDHAIYGEEEGRSGDSPFLWLVDPIDGTKSFVRGYPMFSTQIALMVEGELLVGVSCASEFGETAWARRGAGAFLDGRPLRCASTADWQRATLSTGNLKSLARGAGWQQLGELVPQLHRIRGYGDFFHYHLLARGAIDLVLESDVNILDIAALAVIVREAGGVFTDLDGSELDLATRSVLAGTPGLHARGLAHFAGWRG